MDLINMDFIDFGYKLKLNKSKLIGVRITEVEYKILQELADKYLKKEFREKRGRNINKYVQSLILRHVCERMIEMYFKARTEKAEYIIPYLFTEQGIESEKIIDDEIKLLKKHKEKIINTKLEVKKLIDKINKKYKKVVKLEV